jgi:hypothetical protein
VENTNPVQGTFKLSQPGPILLVATQLLYVGYRAVWVPLFVISLRGAGWIWVAQLLVLLLVSGVKGHLLNQGIFVGDCQHVLRHHGVLHGKLVDQWRVLVSLLEEHDDVFVIDLWDDVSLVAKALDKLLEILSLLLYGTSQVPVDSWSCAHCLEVVDELST